MLNVATNWIMHKSKSDSLKYLGDICHWWDIEELTWAPGCCSSMVTSVRLGISDFNSTV